MTDADGRFAALLDWVAQNLDRFPPPPANRDDPFYAVERGLLYLRLSKDEGKVINSIDVQRAATTDLCDRMDWEVLDEFVDEGVSGRAFEDRPAWDRVVQAVQAMPPEDRKRTAIVFKTVDRFGRNELEMEKTRADLEGLGVRLRFADYPFLLPETDEGFILYKTLCMLAEFERRQIVRRTKDGLKLRRKRGVHLGHMPQFFTKNDQKQLVPTEVAEKVVRMRAGGASYVAIGREVGISRHDAYNLCSFVRRKTRAV